MKRPVILLQIPLIIIPLLISCNGLKPGEKLNENKTGEYVAGDFHQHTTYSEVITQ